MPRKKNIKVVDYATKSEVEKKIRAEFRSKKIKNNLYRQRAKMGFSILSVILFCLLLVYLLRLLNGISAPPTFSSLLDTLVNGQSFNFDMNFNSLDLNSGLIEEWTILDGFRQFLYGTLEVFETIINFVIWLFKGFYNIFVYIVNILRWALGINITT